MVIVIVASVFGYAIFTLLAAIFNFENQSASITFRALTLGLSLFLLLFGSPRLSGVAGVLFVLFWLLYFTRLLVTLVLVGEAASNPAEFYWTWAVGVSFIPSLACLCIPIKHDYAKLGVKMLIAGIPAVISILYLGDTVFENGSGVIYDRNRLALEALNPIAVGHLGASLFLTASGLFLAGSNSRTGSIIVLFAASSGLILILKANSFGPMVSVAVALLTLALAQIGRRRTWFYGALVIGVSLVFFIGRANIMFGDGGVVSRFDRMVSGDDLSAATRFELYGAALKQFLASPLTGDGIEVREFSFYPHNVIIEAFMVTGVLGGLIFCFLLLIAMRRAWYIFRYDPKANWLGLVAIQYIVGAQMSGSIYQAGAMWLLVTCLCSMPQLKKRQFPRRSQMMISSL